VIGISLLTLVPGELGGTETYARGLTRALAGHGELEYRAFLPPVVDEAGGLPVEHVPEYRRARTIPERVLAMALAAARPGPIRRRLEAASALHYPLTIALPEARRPYAVTLQDVLHHDRPELFPRAEALFRRRAYDRSARRATLVIVPTAFTAERLAGRLGVPAERLRVVPLGIDHERFTPPADGVRESFLLYPARAWPHKNHARLFDAFELARRERPELRLVLTGGGHPPGPHPPGVEVRGLVSGDELVSLYRRASALVFPSLYEGFGWPPLEAMACGCPVASSNTGSLPEVTGDAARLFDPSSPEEIAAAIGDVLDRPDDWISRGLEQASRFTWAACARGHEAVYRELTADG
jgi:glycosyltransferase involved in cell wall biosynthesis